MHGQRQTFGEEVRAIRRARRLTQQALSDLLGECIGHGQISRYEGGDDLPPHISAVNNLIEALGCSPSERRRLLTSYIHDVLRRLGITSQWKIEEVR